MSKAILKSRAKKVYVSNIMNQPGQTAGYTLARYINELERYIGKHVLDYAIVNNGVITEEMMKDFNQEESYPVKIDLENIQNRAISVIKEDLVLTAPGSIIHDSDRLAEIIMAITKSKKIGKLNIVKIKRKHMENERKIRSKYKNSKIKIKKPTSSCGSKKRANATSTDKAKTQRENSIMNMFDKIKSKAEYLKKETRSKYKMSK